MAAEGLLPAVRPAGGYRGLRFERGAITGLAARIPRPEPAPEPARRREDELVPCPTPGCANLIHADSRRAGLPHEALVTLYRARLA